ncbi:MAG: DNA mismatch repair endonuclease MutL [Isosphaeraceae bacterium]
MGIIRELPTSVINQIAAGEVVERPASVAKELLENAIDAGATRIELTVERGGKDLVRIADDGKGMDPEDLPLAFRPHATSKLASAEDLHRVATLGFRGEALAAIAEVSRVRCQTRTPGAQHGSEMEIEAGTAGPIKPHGGPDGTVIEVRNLFFNTPVRRTFLRADSTEAGHVIDAFQRIALAHPTVHLTYRSAGKTVYDLPAVTGIRERVAVFFGQELADSLLWVESQVDQAHLWGYVAHPSQSRSSTKGQYLFLGGRYVRDRSLGHALGEAYRGLLMVGRSPVAFLHLEIPPEEVDVNVHPTKIEVRFRDSQRIYSQVLASVRKTFLASDLHSRLQAPKEPPIADSGPSAYPAQPDPPALRLEPLAPSRQEVASWFEPARDGRANSPFEASRPAPSWAMPLGTSPPPMPTVSASQFDEFAPPPSVPAPPAASPPSEPSAPQFSASGQLPIRALQVHDSYLVVETDEGMIVIDQHALHERILYEEFRDRVARGRVESQRLLVPMAVDLPESDATELLGCKDVLERLGLTIEADDSGRVELTGVPVLLGHARPERLLADLADHLRSQPLPPTRDGVLQGLLSTMACKAAVKAGDRLTPGEIAALLERADLARDAHHCPHGRPTALTFTKAELERQFGRI